jgi:diguanylate cyclase (GGDEF)-like protein/PAS domain S-box-containing protein
MSHAVAFTGIAILGAVLWIVGGSFAVRDAVESRLAVEATTDSLTDLLNRAGFIEALTRSSQLGAPLILAFVDLDDFKDINDTYGHHVGDEVLAEVGRRIARVARAQDVIARIGGDEFVLLVRPEKPMEGQRLVERIQRTFAEPWPMIAPSVVKASIGIVEDPTGSRTPDDLLSGADREMYARKHGMRPDASVPVMTSRALARYRVAMDGLMGTFLVVRAIREDDAVVDWEVLEANQALRDEFAGVCSGIVGMRMSVLEQAAPSPQMHEICARAMSSGQPVDEELEIQRVNGDRIWVNVSVVPVERDVLAVASRDIMAQKAQRDALACERARSAALVANVSDIIAICAADGRLMWVSSAVTPALGLTTDEVVGVSAFDLIHPDDHNRVAERLGDVVADPNIDAAPTYRWFEASGTNKLDDPALEGIVVSLRDITDRRSTEVALRASEERNRSIVEAAADAIITVDPGGLVQSFNRSAEKIFGIRADEVVGQSYVRFLPGASLDALRDAMAHGRTGEQIATTARRGSGEEFPAQIALSRVFVNEVQLFTAVVRDVTEQRALEEALRNAAQFDELTGLPNRRMLLGRVDAAISRAGTQGGSLGLLFVDLDRFKLVNDALGHDVGDQVLMIVAERIASCCRQPDDLVARIGADEFVVLCETPRSLETISALAARITQALEIPVDMDGATMFVSASIGVAEWHEGETALDLLRFADTAMYRAKARGRSQLELFDDRMREEVTARLDFESALRQGVNRNELETHYQPIIDLESKRISHFEALVRWNRPGVGLVSPNDFIPAAEAAGLVVPIGEWVLAQATRDCAGWQDVAPGVGVSVNVSVRQFDAGDLVKTVQDALASAGLAPHLLTLEITETVLLDQTERNAAIMTRIRELGIHIALDDFGSGYSSLTYLRRLPIDSIKIDRSFLQSLETDSRDLVLLKAIGELGNMYGLDVIAEGIDTEEKLAAVRAVGCAYGQGYLFARPAPVAESIALLAIDSAMG